MKVHFLLLFLSWHFISFSQTVEKTFKVSGSYENLCHSLCLTQDKSAYIMAGYTSPSASNKDLLISKIGIDLVPVWTKTFSSSNNEYIKKIIPTSDGGFFAVGNVEISGLSQQTLMIKLSSTGTIEWSKSFGNYGLDEGFSMIEVDGKLYMVGRTNINGHLDGFAFCFNLNGTLNWANAIGSSSNEYLYSVKLSSEGKLIAVGATNYNGSYDIWVTKLNLDGTLIWSKTYGSNNDDGADDLLIKGDSIYITGHTRFNAYNDMDYPLLKISNDGVVGSFKTYGTSNNERAYSINRISQNQVFISGYANGPSFTDDCWELKLNNNSILSSSKSGTSASEKFLTSKIFNSELVLGGYSTGTIREFYLKKHSISDNNLGCPYNVNQYSPSISTGSTNATSLAVSSSYFSNYTLSTNSISLLSENKSLCAPLPIEEISENINSNNSNQSTIFQIRQNTIFNNSEDVLSLSIYSIKGEILLECSISPNESLPIPNEYASIQSLLINGSTRFQNQSLLHVTSEL
jgi:hypothetical protein